MLEVQPGEKVRLDVPVSDRMRKGDAIQTVNNVTTTNITAGGTGSIDTSGFSTDGYDAQALFDCTNAVNGEYYRVEAIVTTLGGDVIKADKILYCKD